MPINLRAIICRIKKLNILHRIYTQRAAAENGLFFGQLPVLEYVSDHDRCTQTEIAENLQVSAPSIAISIKRMEKNGLLKKVRCANDSRTNRISITAKGLKFASKCRITFDAIDARMFSGFTAKECDDLCRYIDRLIANMDTAEFRDKSIFSMIDTIKKEKKHD